jgi:hypothetical protein
MFSCCKSKAALFLAGLVLVGGASLAAWRAFAPPGPQPRPAGVTAPGPQVAKEEEKPKPELEGPGHLEPKELLDLSLVRLHREAITRFSLQPGFGLSRMPIFPELVKKEWKVPVWSPGELDSEKPAAEGKDLTRIHADSLKDFQVGKISDRSPADLEAPRTVPFPTGDPAKIQAGLKQKDWEVKSLDLIGLVKHEDPVVYLSDKLPEMKKRKDVPTRTPDLFELAGLERLRKGEDLFARSREGTVRMLGAVRATGECAKCHHSEEGALLGAFSYTLRPAEWRANVGGFPSRPKVKVDR